MKYEIVVCRTAYAHRTVVVEAVNAQAAIQTALEHAGDHEYSEHTSEYDITSTKELK